MFISFFLLFRERKKGRKGGKKMDCYKMMGLLRGCCPLLLFLRKSKREGKKQANLLVDSNDVATSSSFC